MTKEHKSRQEGVVLAKHYHFKKKIFHLHRL
jgi:hypothetical protein